MLETIQSTHILDSTVFSFDEIKIVFQTILQFIIFQSTSNLNQYLENQFGLYVTLQNKLLL